MGKYLAPFCNPTESHPCCQKKSAPVCLTINIQMLVESIILTPKKRKFGFPQMFHLICNILCLFLRSIDL